VGDGRWYHRPIVVSILLFIVAVLPFLVALGIAMHDGWHPIGDDGAIAVLTHDVFSHRTPLVGMPSTVGGPPTLSANRAHHPGPLLFWVLAPFEWLARSAPIGLLMGAVLVNVVAVGLIAWFTRRIAGTAAAVGALVLCVVMMWGLGRQAIVEIWNPYLAVFPVFALLVSAWAVLNERPRALWVVMFLASFVVQAHLLYGPLALAMVLVSAAGVTYTFVQRAHRQQPWKRELTLVIGVALAILTVVWALPIVDQVIHSPGNFSAVGLGLNTDTGASAGVAYALRVVMQSIAAPPLFARQSAGIGIIGASWGAVGALRVVTAVVVFGALVGGLVVAVRRRDRVAISGGALALLSLVIAVLTLAPIPDAARGEVPYYRLLEVWSIGAFVWLTIAVIVVRSLHPHAARWSEETRRNVRVSAAVLAGLVLVSGSVAVAFSDSNTIIGNPRLYRAVSELADAVAPRLHKGQPYEIDTSSPNPFLAGDVQLGLVRELLRRGYDARVPTNDPYLSRAHGAPTGSARIYIQAPAPDNGAPPAPGAEQLARVGAATAGDMAALPAIDNALAQYLRDATNLTAAGLRARDDPSNTDLGPRLVHRLFNPKFDPIALVKNGTIAELVKLELMNPEVGLSDVARRYAAAHEVTDQEVFTAWLIPASAPPAAGA
jgi:hypothetical protein